MNIIMNLLFILTSVISFNNKIIIQLHDVETTEEIEIIEEVEIKDERKIIECKEGDILFEQDGVKIQVKEYNSNFAPYSNICFWIENFSGQKLTFCSDMLSIDGYMSNSLLYESVMNNSGATVYIALNDKKLQQDGITNPDYFEVAFSICDENGSVIYKTDIFNIKTKFHKEETANQNTRVNTDDTETIIYDADGIKIVARKNITKDDFGDLCIPFYIENNSDVTVRVYSLGTAFINEIEDDILFAEDLFPGGKSNAKAISLSNEINKLEPEDIETLKIRFSIKHIDTDYTMGITDFIEIQYK